MNASHVPYDTPYMRLLVGLFLVLGGACSVYFIGLDLDGELGVVPPPFQTQVLCFLATAFATFFFAWPRACHFGLIAVVAAALFLGWADASPIALGIRLAALAALLLPLPSPLSLMRRATAFAKRKLPLTTVPNSAS